MSVPETLRRLYSGIAIVMILTLSLPAWADGEAEQIARANKLIAEKKYDDAIAILTPLKSSAEPIAQEAKNALQLCYRSVGMRYKEMGNCPEAIGPLLSALKLTPTDYKGEVVDALYECYRLTNDTEGMAMLRMRLADRCIRKAWKLQNGAEYAKALDGFREMVNLFPDCGPIESAHVCIAECLQSLGKPEEGMAYAKKLYDEHPEMRAGALFAQGVLSFLANSYDASIAAFRRVIVEYPDNKYAGLALPFLASALAKTGRTNEAVETLRAVSEEASDPEEKSSSLLRIGEIYQEAKLHKNAIAAFSEVRELKDAPAETKAEATYRSGLCYQEMKYYSSARTCMDRVVKLYPDTEWARKAGGSLYVWSNSDKQTEAK